MESTELERAIHRGDFDGALAEPSGSLGSDSTGKAHALVGLCHFQSQRYEEAARAYQAASRHDRGGATPIGEPGGAQADESKAGRDGLDSPALAARPFSLEADASGEAG